jgi:hypothetical protein
MPLEGPHFYQNHGIELSTYHYKESQNRLQRQSGGDFSRRKKMLHSKFLCIFVWKIPTHTVSTARTQNMGFFRGAIYLAWRRFSGAIEKSR